jgi:enoyl-CoA hydratase
MRQAVAILGHRTARLLLCSGVLIFANDALTAGAIDEIAENDDVLARAVAKCRELCEKDSRLFSAIERTLQQAPQMTDEALLEKTLSDLDGYLGDPRSADARSRFLTRNKKAKS